MLPQGKGSSPQRKLKQTQTKEEEMCKNLTLLKGLESLMSEESAYRIS